MAVILLCLREAGLTDIAQERRPACKAGTVALQAGGGERKGGGRLIKMAVPLLSSEPQQPWDFPS